MPQQAQVDPYAEFGGNVTAPPAVKIVPPGKDDSWFAPGSLMHEAMGEDEADENVITPKRFLQGAAKNLYEVSAPNVLHQTYKRVTGQPNDLGGLPAKAAEFFTYSVLGEPAATGERAGVEANGAVKPQVRIAPPVSDTSLRQSTPIRLAKAAAQEGIEHIPGVKFVRGIAKRMEESTPPPPPPPPAPPAAPRVSLPAPKFDVIGANDAERGMLAVRGQRPPVTVLPPSGAQLALPSGERAAPAINTPKIGDLAKEAVRAAGGEPTPPPLAAGKPIYQRTPSVASPSKTPVAASEPSLKPVEGSSAISGHHYDPATQTMTVEVKSGGRYRYGEVTPEEAQAFEQAPSKGRAYKDLRDNHVQTGKMVNGKWTVGTPKSVSASPEGEFGSITRVGSKEMAVQDTNLFKQARKELGEDASVSDVARRAQEMKTAAKAAYGEFGGDVLPDEDLTPQLQKSLEEALKKKKQ